MTKASCDGSALDCNKAIKEILRLENRWEELKEWLESYNNPSYTLGKPTIYQAVQKKMKEMEEND